MTTYPGSTTPSRAEGWTITRDIVLGVGSAVVLWGLLAVALPFYDGAARRVGGSTGDHLGIAILALGGVGALFALLVTAWPRRSAVALATAGGLFSLVVGLAYWFPDMLPDPVWIHVVGPVVVQPATHVLSGMLLAGALVRGVRGSRQAETR